MKPEEKARIIIDRMLNDAGWEVVDRNHYSPEVSAIAIEEGCLLYTSPSPRDCS